MSQPKADKSAVDDSTCNDRAMCKLAGHKYQEKRVDIRFEKQTSRHTYASTTNTVEVTPEEVEEGGCVISDLCIAKAGGHPEEHGCFLSHHQQCLSQQ